MVSTRSSSKASASASSIDKRSSGAQIPGISSPVQTLRDDSKRATGTWSHTPSNLTLLWLAISLPLVIWDTFYVFLRPHSMAGGKLQWPLWMPYELYATVDYVYGWPSYEQRNGFTAAQASLNVVETLAYLVYLWILFAHGKQKNVDGRGALDRKSMGWLAQSQAVDGKWAAYAVLILYGTSLMTFSKTILYWLNEAFSGFANIGHNDLYSLIVLWIIPNGAWIAVPAYMIYVSGKEIVQGLEISTNDTRKHQ